MDTSLLFQRTRNLGDDMMTLAVARLLRRRGLEPVGAIDRERVSHFDGERILPMSAWWKFATVDWPPAPGIVPLPIGVHLASPALVEGHEEWWRQWQPVGCRDRHTMEMLQARGIDAWWSGCATLTLGDWCGVDWKPDPALEERLADALLLPLPRLGDAVDKTVLVDCGTVRGCEATAPGAVRASHQIRPERVATLSLADRLYLAGRMARTYWTASSVVTTRLHAYLPALAMGKPAVLLGPSDGRTADYLGMDAGEAREMGAAFARDFTSALESRGAWAATGHGEVDG